MHSLLASEDYAYAIENIREKYPNSHLVGIGISMGAGLLLKHAAESGNNCRLKGLAVVATPFNQHHSAKKSEEGISFFNLPKRFILSLLKRVVKKIESELHQWPDHFRASGIDFSRIMKADSYTEFDSAFTAKMHGLKDAEEYYKRGSTYDCIEQTQIPVFALSALDDPVVHSGGIPYESFRQHPNVILATTTTGGHTGWYSGNFIPKRTFHIPCLEFLEACIQIGNHTFLKA